MLLLVVLLAVKVQYVSCPGDTWLKAATLASHLDTSAPAPQPNRNDIWYVSKTYNFKHDKIWFKYEFLTFQADVLTGRKDKNTLI